MTNLLSDVSDQSQNERSSPLKQLLRGKHILTLIQTLLTFCFLVYGPSKTQGMRTRDMDSVEFLTRALHCPSRYLFQSFHLPVLSPVYSVPEYKITPFSSEFLPSVSFTVAATLVSAFTYCKHVSSSYVLSSIAWFTYLALLLPTLGLVGRHVWGTFFCFVFRVHLNTNHTQGLLRIVTHTFRVLLCSHLFSVH